ncbi:sensor histidine kinase [Spongiactinospora sp. TRM90649]|uniref:sensor histidine kinase n=1 Tax=Spongiactinospora sp. TRM90649 TaxID=3031114 RepID=UPI0023F97D04|nr:sensor histidine kinase [Spongiactinospora sp. TRM90649]MDF5753309.1 sensor histidine kinase [Spongiactinospora sp. TRM90649]
MQPERAVFASGSFAHIAAPYDSDESWLRLVLPVIVEALREGHDILVVTGQNRHDMLTERLGEDAGRVDRRLRNTWYTHPARTLTAYHEYAEPWAKRQTLLIGEPVWLGRGARDLREWVRYEAAINLAFADAPIVALCLYDRLATPPQVLDDAMRAHPWTLGGDGLRASEGYVPPKSFLLSGDELPFTEPPPARITVPFGERDLSMVRQAVAAAGENAGLDRDTVGSLVLSVSEIAANTVEHGGGTGSVSIWASGDELICEVLDPGGRLDVPLPGFLPPRPESPRGYGLWISRQLCDLVETRITDGVLRVRLYMILPNRR